MQQQQQQDPDLIAWEVRPGGMLVQKRDGEDVGSGLDGPMIKLKVSRGLHFHEVCVSAHASFGEVKKLLVQETGLEPHEQRLLFRGKEKDDSEYLHVAGVKDKAKLLLVEDPASRERRMEQMRNNDKMEKTCKSLAAIGLEVDELARQLTPLETSVNSGKKVPEMDLDRLTELMMRQVLKLDAIEAEGEAKVQRRVQVRRVQNYVDKLDGLKNRNAVPHPAVAANKSVVTTKWETFENGVGSLTAPRSQGSATMATDWESFD